MPSSVCMHIFLPLGHDAFNVFVWGTTIYTISIYWIFSGFYMLLDITNKPRFLRKFKTQPGLNEPLERSKLFKVCHI